MPTGSPAAGVFSLAVAVLLVVVPANASSGSIERSLTIRLMSAPGRTTVKDVAPKTMAKGELTKGDTISGTSILRNAVAQFGKPKGKIVGSDSYTLTAMSGSVLRISVRVKLPGGTLRVAGKSAFKRVMTAPVVGGTGAFAGARGVYETTQLPRNRNRNVYRLRLP